MAVAVFIGSSCGNDPATTRVEATAEPAEDGLQAVNLGPRDAEIRVDPVHIDGDGAMFLVTIDSEGPPDLARSMDSSTLVVNGENWPRPRWETLTSSGDRLHGELFFALGGPVQGTARLTLKGLPDSPHAEWRL